MVGVYRRKSCTQLNIKKTPPSELQRDSRSGRGYDGDWVRARDDYMQNVAMGRCQECMRRGYLKPANVVDHIEPVVDSPELRLNPDNFDALCHFHHNGWKRRLEAYARKIGAVRMLRQWVKNPDLRPIQFQVIRYGPMKEMFDAEREQDLAGTSAEG